MIDPAKTTPQTPRALCVGSKGFARAQRAAMAGSPPPAAETDDDEDEEDDEDQESSKNPGAALADHEPVRAAAEEAHTAAAEAYKASKGTDSAAALMRAEDMGDAAGDAHEKAKASSMALRGATPDGQAPPPPAGPAPPGGRVLGQPPLVARLPVVSLARAIAATGGTAEAQAKIAATIAFADRMSALFGGASLDEVEGHARAAKADAADALQLRTAAEAQKKKSAKRAEEDADAALRAKLAGAVRARKYERAELFDVAESVDAQGNAVEVLTPQAWTRAMAPAALDAMLAAKQARAGSGGALVPDETPVTVSAAVQSYGRARGWPAGDPRYANLAANLPTTATAPQEPK